MYWCEYAWCSHYLPPQLCLLEYIWPDVRYAKVQPPGTWFPHQSASIRASRRAKLTRCIEQAIALEDTLYFTVLHVAESHASQAFPDGLALGINVCCFTRWSLRDLAQVKVKKVRETAPR